MVTFDEKFMMYQRNVEIYLKKYQFHIPNLNMGKMFYL